jgi:hypothetical protein
MLTRSTSQVAGRVIVDAYAYYLSHNMVKPQLRELVSQENSSGEISDESSEGTEDDSDDSLAGSLIMTAAKSPDKGITRNEVLDALTDDQCLLATPWLKGLDLKTKEWGMHLLL